MEPRFEGVYLDGKPGNTLWDVTCKDGVVSSIVKSSRSPKDGAQFVGSSLCHPHIHLDKCFLLSHPKYADLEIQKGDFAEALKLTSTAKAMFELDDLLERGRALISESISFGVTHMRAFVEVDSGVGMKCLEAGLLLKEEFKDSCFVQICVFAQDPIFSYDDGGEAMRSLLEEAVVKPGVDAFGSTPYVEKGHNLQVQNVEYAINLATKHKLHLDFHIDYNLDSKQPSTVLEAVDILRGTWPSDPDSPNFRTIAFGHCTRLTLFDKDDWKSLYERTKSLPISFIGLPTSDLFMMGRPTEESGWGERPRGTLPIPQMIGCGLNAAMGINNVGNAFTPHGSCDPLSLASFGVGVYQAGTKKDAEILYTCVSDRAKIAIGIPVLPLEHGGDFVVFRSRGSFRARKTIQSIVYDPPHERETVFKGRIVGHR